jgi:glycogen synthase
MKLLLTTDTVGGVWTYALELCTALAPLGVRVALASMGAAPTDEQRREAGACGNVTLFESTYKLEWMEDPWDDVQEAGHWLLDIEEQVEPDVVHLNGYAHGSLPFCAPVMVVAHSCVLSWHQAVKGRSVPPAWERYRQAVCDGLRDADLVIAPSLWMLDAVERHYGRLPRTRVIANGRRAELFPAGAKEPIIFSAGRLWDEAKNLSALDAVAPKIDWPVYVAGDTCRPRSAQAAAGTAHVQCLGRLTTRELAGWLGRSSIYCLPARYEPFGLSVLEAALAGCALVLGDIPSLREIWQDAALFVNGDDPDALAAALKRLGADAALRDDLAQRSRARALQYTPRRMAAEYLEAYQGLVQLRRDSGRPVMASAAGRSFFPLPIP